MKYIATILSALLASCGDGGDLQVDFPFDPECSSPDDDDERNL